MIAVENKLLLTDGDTAILRVDNRRPPHALEPGVAASANNLRFDDGKPRPRFGVAEDAWGAPGTNLAAGAVWDTFNILHAYVQISGFTPGKDYRFARSFAGETIKATLSASAASVISASGSFTATQPAYYLFIANAYGLTNVVEPGDAVQTRVVRVANTCGYGRFSDPLTDTDQGLLLTDDIRNGAGEDGGRGRCWRILPGNGPQEVSLNGHDVWGTARLIQCKGQMVMLRHGNQRYYFAASAVNATTDVITLNVTPNWAATTGRRVRFELDADGSQILGSSAPAPGNYYYAKNNGSNTIKLYSDAAMSNQMVFDAGTLGRFYIEEAIDPVPFWGNGAVPLILQPSLTENAFDAGWAARPSDVAITDTTTSVVTAPNHGLRPGDAVTVTGLTIGTAAPYFAFPTSDHTLTLHTSATLALTGASPIADITAGGTGSIKRTSAAGVPMPPGREGCYIAGRLWIINGDDQIVMSDPDDFLHFTLFVSQVPANQGEAGRANWLRPLGEDVLCIGKNQKIIALSGIGGAVSGWKEGTITAEYGGLAALAALSVGSDVQFASRKGWASVVRTVAGERLGTSRTISQAVREDLADIDWANAPLMCAETWNGRLFWAVPMKGQEAVVNNRVLVLNYNNAQLYVEQAELAGDLVGRVRVYDEGATGPDSWEGYWTGDLLTPYAFARLTVNGEERLTFATPDGVVRWLHDGWDDAGAEITTELITRGYFGSREVLALKGAFKWETHRPKLSCYIRSAGYNEEEQLAGFAELQYDRTQYLANDQTDYDPATSTTAAYDLPHRADYSAAPGELLVARLDVHQAITEPFRCRVRDHTIQLRIVNAQGSARLCAVTIQGKPAGISATRKT